MPHTSEASTIQSIELATEQDQPATAAAARAWRAHQSDPTVVSVGEERFRIHPNGGGLVAFSATVAPSVFVGPRAMVRDHAIVVGSVRLFDRSAIEGWAIVADSCTLRQDSTIGGDAIVRGKVTLAHNARIDGEARVQGGVLLQHFAHISRGVLSGGMTVN